ncbi:hypothetical protein [Spirochaeta isovalerica]|uniref:Fe-S-cluster formation regulator IscX/YfhJ n=1 Tax=Spirochaeta isovalerica TaxID=150 RepID=A0A841RCG0_9SPIO|nr:hypothetical protein [Spirochaeta isovalerica]MBB6480917.1 Fe-S-cluster formation regulator IscX/YfhJ [Spirochaeta isovalerica]
MDIAGLLGTFSTSLGFYIDEFNRIFIHVSENLPIVGNQIEARLGEIRTLQETEKDDSELLKSLVEDLGQVRIPIFEIIIEMQRQDIINQQLNHLVDAVTDVREIIVEDEAFFEDFDKKKGSSELKEDYRHLFTLVSFLLNNLEKQMGHINNDLTDLVDIMDQRFSDLHTRIIALYNDRKEIDRSDKKNNQAVLSAVKSTKTLSFELEQYSNFFKRLRILQEDLNRELVLCISLKEDVETNLNDLGGPLPLKECRFTSTIIQKIVDKLSVEEERQALRDEYSELHIEESFTRDVVLF